MDGFKLGDGLKPDDRLRDGDDGKKKKKHKPEKDEDDKKRAKKKAKKDKKREFPSPKGPPISYGRDL